MSAGGVFDGVGEDLLHHQLQPLLVREHLEAGLLQLQGHPAPDEEGGVLPGGLAEDGVQCVLPDEVVGAAAVQSEVAQGKLHIPLHPEELRLQVPDVVRRVLPEEQAHGGDGGLDLVDPHGVIVQGLPPAGVGGGGDGAQGVPQLQQEGLVDLLPGPPGLGELVQEQCRLSPQALQIADPFPAAEEVHRCPDGEGRRAQQGGVAHRLRREVVEPEYLGEQPHAQHQQQGEPGPLLEISPDDAHIPSSLLDQIPQPLLRPDKLGEAQALQLPPEAGHIDGQGVLIHKAVRLPEALHEGLSGHGPALLLQEHLQHAVLVPGELQLLALVGQGVVSGVQHRTPGLQQGCGGAEVVGPAQEGLDLGGEHVQVKGLGHEVVAAHVHGHDDVHVVRRGGEEDDGHPADFPHPGAPVVAVAEGQADVQQDQVGPKGLELLQHALEIHHAMDLPAPGIQVLGHRARDGLVVLYEKNPVHDGASFQAFVPFRFICFFLKITSA